MKLELGFKTAFLTVLGGLTALYLYQLVTYILTNQVINPLLNRLLAGN